MTQLSEQQRQAIRAHPDEPLTVIDSVMSSTYVWVPAAMYERMRALFEEDEPHPGELAPLVDEVLAKEGWDDPAMDAYNDLDPRRSA